MIRAFVLSVVGLAVGLGTLALVRDSPGMSFSGATGLGAAGLLVAGWLAIGVGLGLTRRARRSGVYLIMSGFAWFIAEWDNPAVGSSVVFTTGLVCATACPALVAHAALSYPSGRVSSVAERMALGTAYFGTLGLLGVLPAMAFDPAEQGCSQCAGNLAGVTSGPEFVESTTRVGIRVGLAWAVALAVLMTWRLVRATHAARRVQGPVLVPAVGYLCAVAGAFGHSSNGNGLLHDAVGRQWWLVQSAGLCLISLGVVAGWVRLRRARSTVAALVVEVAEAPPPGGVRGALAIALGDPDLDVAYRINDGRFLDAAGAEVPIDGAEGRATTAVVRDGQTVAVLRHRAELLGDPQLVEAAASAAGLALEHERLHAEAQAQLSELRTSRRRLVASSDAERLRLERDLHDGAQQRLVGLALAMRLVRTQLGANSAVAAEIAAAEHELRLALDDLRDLASGIHPSVLSDYGLAAAIEALAERAPAPIRLVGSDDRRFPPATETAVYLVVAAAARLGRLSVEVAAPDGAVVVDIDAEGVPPELDELADRIGALDGAIDVERLPAGTHIRAMVPCA